MELMNSLLRYKTIFIQKRQVKKERLINLKIAYHQGLDLEFQKTLDDYYDKETGLIHKYHKEALEPLKKRIDGTTKFDEKREKLIYRFDQRKYWQRRRLKVKHKDLDASALKNVLDTFDLETKTQRETFINDIEQKYPHQELDQISLNALQDKVKHLEDKKQQDLDKATKKHEALKKKTVSKLKQNKKILEKLMLKKERLTKDIDAYNEQRHLKNGELVDQLTQKIDDLEKANGKQKKINKLKHKLKNIQTVDNVLNDTSIHLSVSNLKMYFGGVKAVDDLSFDVKKGEIFGLIGPNGAGKTTVFNCLTQFYKATSGHMILKNKENHIVDLYRLKTHDIIKEGIARSFQNVELIWELTVIDNLMVSAHSLLITGFFDHIIHTRKLYREDLVIRTKAMQILKDLGIEDYAYRSPYGLPYGILKKIELARTLMTNPSMIILDEPAAGLNDSETLDLAKVIKHINKTYETTIFLVEHDMSLVMSICDTICAISFGKRIGLGTPKEIQNNPEVRKAYLGDDQDE